MERFKDDFRFSLKGIDFSTLERSRDCIYGLSKKLKLTYFNPAYTLFAKENGMDKSRLGKSQLGKSIISTIKGAEIREFYIEKYKHVIDTGDVWHHDYECSGKKEFRMFHQRVYPLANGEGLIVRNTLTVNLPMHHTERKAFDPVEMRYVQSSGNITQCSNCRHTQSMKQPEIWHWIPAWVEQMPPNASHSICPVCFDYYWKYSRINNTSSDKSNHHVCDSSATSKSDRCRT
jgi:hypothetical protein